MKSTRLSSVTHLEVCSTFLFKPPHISAHEKRCLLNHVTKARFCVPQTMRWTWGILALFHIQRWHTDYAPVPSLSHSVFTNGVQATRRNISLKTLPRLRQKVQIGRVHNLFAAIGHRSKRERASSSASPEIIPSMIVHCINNNTCTVGIYLIHGVSDKMLDLAAIKRDWTAKLLFSPLIDAKT